MLDLSVARRARQCDQAGNRIEGGNEMNASEKGQLIDMKRVTEMTTLSRTTLWRMVRQGRFPRPIKISPNRVAWREYDVVDWVQARSEAR
jgi:prophage regulatory protein